MSTPTLKADQFSDGTLLNASGVLKTDSALGSDFSITSTSFADTGLSVDVITHANEIVLVDFQGAGAKITDNGTVFLNLVVDGAALDSPYTQWMSSGNPGYGQNWSFTRVVGPLAAGSHTIKLQAKHDSPSGGTISAPAKLQVTQFRGGYITPENVPILQYSSASAVSIVPAPGADSQLRCVLTDGQRYVSNAALSVNLAASGRGGLDTGAEAASTWYYLYAVPATTAGQLAVVASVTSPVSGGPTGFPAWKYLGAIRNNSSSDIIQFVQEGSVFKYYNGQTPTALSATTLGTSIYSPALRASVADCVPATASSADLLAALQMNSDYRVQALITDYGQTPPSDASGGVVTENVTWLGQNYTVAGGVVPLPNVAKTVLYLVYGGGGSITAQWVLVRGWTDSYLTQTVTQSQPMQTLTGSNGISSVEKVLGSDQTISSDTLASIPSDPCVLSVTTVAGETVMVEYTALAGATGSTGQWVAGVFVDGVSVGRSQVNYLPSGSNSSTSDALQITLNAGPHTIELRVAKVSYNFTLYTGASIRVVRFLGGYSNPDNIPILAYSSASAVAIQAAPGASGQLQVTLSDGQKYTAANPLSVSLNSTGRGGLDTGTKATDTWYYLYAVPPATAGGSFACVASASPPSTGPTGFTAWKYLGAIRYCAAGGSFTEGIMPFFQTGNRFYPDLQNAYDPTHDWTPRGYPASWFLMTSSSGADGSPVSYSLSSVVPATASMATIYLMNGGGGASAELSVFAPNWQGAADAIIWGISNCDIVFDYHLPGTTKLLWLQRTGSTSNCGLKINGWVDGWIQGAPQVQAPAAVNTKLPRLAYATAGSVSVAAAPGQPGTVRATLQDGVQRSFSGALTFAFATGVADGGLDTGSEASSTWYYLYLVPKSTDNSQLAVRGSVTGPATGPTGYTNFVYIGAVRNNSSSDLLMFYQAGASFTYQRQIQPSDAAALGTTMYSTPTPISLVNEVPVTAAEARLSFYIYANNSYVYAGPSIEGATTDFGETLSVVGGGSTDWSSVSVPLPNTPKRVYWHSWGAGNISQQSLYVLGWLDDYLT